MTWNNKSPLANPLNQSSYKLRGSFKRDTNAELPDSSYSYEQYVEYQNSLHVPNQNGLDSTGMITSLDMHSYGKTWDDSKQFDDIMQSATEKQRENYIKQQNAKLSAEMSDEQKDMLAHIEDFMGKSKLIDEST